jgi:hypothetical protein
MTRFQSFRKWCSLPIALLISLGLVFLRIEEPVKKQPCYPGYIKIAFNKGINCAGDTVPLDTMRLTKLLKK